jgi:NAD(P)H dehydrogenase (quinone)
MNVLVVCAHPNSSSFTHAMTDAVATGLRASEHKVNVKDLYAENFDPVLKADDLEQLHAGDMPSRIRSEQDDLLWAEALVFVYPLWWFDRPAILKGWFDVVFTNEVAFSFNGESVQGMLKHQKALVLITAGGTEEYFENSDAMPLIHRPVTDGTLGFCGIDDVSHQIYFNTPNATDEERKAILSEIEVLGRQF